MTRIFINGTFPMEEDSFDWPKELIDKLEKNYDIEYFLPTNDNDKNIYEHDFNCDTILYMITNIHTPINLALGTSFIDDCWSSLSHTSTIKHIGIFYLDENLDNHEDQGIEELRNFIGSIFDLGIKVNPYKLCCAFVHNVDEIISKLEESKIIEKIYE